MENKNFNLLTEKLNAFIKKYYVNIEIHLISYGLNFIQFKSSFVPGRKTSERVFAPVKPKFGVKVSSVRTMNYLGKVKRKQTKTTIQTGRTNAYKKAIVSLVDGDTIDVFSNTIFVWFCF